MVDFVYGVSNFERRRGDFPSLPVVNMFAENVPTEPGVALQSRPGLEEEGTTLGSGPVRGTFIADGVLGNNRFSVSGNQVYVGTTAVGTIDGDGPVSFAGYEDLVFINAGGSIKMYDGLTLTTIAFPDDADVSKIVVGASRLVAVRKDTGKFYWSDPLGDAIDALSFATAENQPDRIYDILFQGDRLIIFGAETVEFWPISGDADTPFTPLVGMVFPVGVKGTGMATSFARTYAWVTTFNEICVKDPENIISEPELQTRIEESTEVSLWTFYVDANEYLVVRLDNETWAYGARSQVWTKLETYGETNWAARCFDGDVFGSALDGRLFQWGDSAYDLDGPMLRMFSAWIALTGDNIKANNIVLRTNPGTTPEITGDYANPVVELRTSRDGGHSWDPWKSRNLGYQGDYRKKTTWASMGKFGYPGIHAQIRVTDPIDFRISGLTMNEPLRGR